MGYLLTAKDSSPVGTKQAQERHESRSVHFSDLALSLVTCANDGVVIFETASKEGAGLSIVYVNQAFSHDTGYRLDELIGKSMQLLEGPKTNLETLARIRAALEAWQPVHEEVLNYKKNGEEIWFAIDLFLISNKDGWFTHWVAMQRNITARKKFEANLGVADRSVRCELYGHYYPVRKQPLYSRYLAALSADELSSLTRW